MMTRDLQNTLIYVRVRRFRSHSFFFPPLIDKVDILDLIVMTTYNVSTTTKKSDLWSNINIIFDRDQKSISTIMIRFERFAKPQSVTNTESLDDEWRRNGYFNAKNRFQYLRSNHVINFDTQNHIVVDVKRKSSLQYSTLLSKLISVHVKHFTSRHTTRSWNSCIPTRPSSLTSLWEKKSASWSKIF